MPNLRVLYNNLADIATITSNSTGSTATNYPASNLSSSRKHLVWRSNTTTGIITLTWSTPQIVNGLALASTTLGPSSTFRLKLYSDTAKTVLLLDTGTVTPACDSVSSSSSETMHIWCNYMTNVRAAELTLSQTAHPSGYLQVSRLVIGQYWSPDFNTDFGVSTGIVDSSENTRTYAGALVTEAKYSYKVLSFSLNFMTNNDRNNLISIVRSVGKQKSVYVSIFPTDTETGKEGWYSIYGKFTDDPTITHPMYTVYTTDISLESW